MLLRDRLRARLAEMGNAPDHQRLAAEVLGIRNAPPDLARRLIAQALVIEERHDQWQRIGERVCAAAPASPGVYILRDERGSALYVGKATNLRRRLRAHFARRHWPALKAGMARAVDAEWEAVGSELEALLREVTLIAALAPAVNVQTGPPALHTRVVPRALLRDLIVVVPSVEEDAVELVAVRADGPWMIQRTRRNGADLAVHTSRLMRFFHSPLGRDRVRRSAAAAARTSAPSRSRPAEVAAQAGGAGDGVDAAPIVFSWLARRGADATRLDPHDAPTRRDLAARLAGLLADERLFTERIDQRGSASRAKRS
jgi:predicted GIY-YIG superfamily endonuclease